MNVEYINPFIEASTSIIKQTTNISPNLGKVYVREKPYSSTNILVMIGLTGKVSGTVVISFSNDIACKIAGAMMRMPVDNLDEIAKSAIGELCNMILGNTATLFSKKGINIDITPPTVLTGSNIQLSIHKSIVVCVPLLFDDGNKIEIDISYIEK